MLEVKNLSFSYPFEKEIIHKISFKAEGEEILSIIGESGSGKSTLLKLIYGLIGYEKGEINFNGSIINGYKESLVHGFPKFKLLEQDFGLMPYTTVRDNIGKNLSNVDIESKNKRIDSLLSLVEMNKFGNIKTKFLSGGQQQRVALAMTLAQMPEVLLLDEPFSQIDNFRKNILKKAIFDYCKENKIIVIHATHEIDDVLAYADKMIIIKDGYIEQIGSPEQVYNNPRNRYVSSLFGEINIFTKKDNIEAFDDISDSKKIMVYPHELSISKNKGDIQVKVINCFFLGSSYMIEAIYNNLKIIYFKSKYRLQTKSVYNLKISNYREIEE